MRKIIILFSVLCCTSAFALDADFSKSFVVPEGSEINKVTIGGIDTQGNSYNVDFSLQEDLTLAITNASVQNSLNEKLEQQLRNTQWQGTYVVNNDFSNTTVISATTLNLVVVQDGYVGGEIIHAESVDSGDGFLHARVTGDIITQFEINGSFVDEDRIDSDDFAVVTDETPSRQLIRIKRMRALGFRDNNASFAGWSTNREYRLVLENGILSGTVGIPSDYYGSSNGATQIGSITLVQQPN